MNWLAIVELILEFLAAILRDRTPKSRVTLLRARRIYQSKRFREWAREEKGIDLD